MKYFIITKCRAPPRGESIIMCFPSSAIRQYGKFHSANISAAIAFQSAAEAGAVRYVSATVFQIP